MSLLFLIKCKCLLDEKPFKRIKKNYLIKADSDVTESELEFKQIIFSLKSYCQFPVKQRSGP